MKYLMIFILMLTVFLSYGQDKNLKTPKSIFLKNLQIGVNFSPDFCFRTLQNNDGSSSSSLVVSRRNNSEIPKFGYTLGVNACLNINKFIGLETGIQYSNKGYQTKNEEITFWTSQTTAQSQFVYNFHYIDIPIKVNFTIGEKKVRFFTSIGVTTNFFIQETVTHTTIYTDRTEKQTNSPNYNYNKINISPTISAGIDYQINDKMNLRIEPTFRYGILKTVDEPVTGYLYNGGLNIGYYIRLI